MRDVTHLPGSTDRPVVQDVVVRTLDHLATTAIDAGWSINRRGMVYLTATRTTEAGTTEQVAVSMVDGRLKASRVTVLEETNVSDQVVAWLEEER